MYVGSSLPSLSAARQVDNASTGGVWNTNSYHVPSAVCLCVCVCVWGRMPGDIHVEAATPPACVYACEWWMDVLESRGHVMLVSSVPLSSLQLLSVWFCETQTVHVVILTSSLLVLGVTTEVSTHSNTLHVCILIDVHLLFDTRVCDVCLRRGRQAGMYAVHRCRPDVIEHDEGAVYV